MKNSFSILTLLGLILSANYLFAQSNKVVVVQKCGIPVREEEDKYEYGLNYIGGQSAMLDYFKKNVDSAVLAESKDKGIVLSFMGVTDSLGNFVRCKLLTKGTGHGGLFETEGRRLIESIKKWNPCTVHPCQNELKFIVRIDYDKIREGY